MLPLPERRTNDRFTGPILLVVLLVGCAGSPSSTQDGMVTWVDERGRVRYSTAPEGKTEERSIDEEDPDRLRATPSDPESPADPVYNERRYPDGDKVVEGRDNLYYSWFGADGRIYNTPYALAEEKQARVSKPEQRPDLSQALVTHKGDISATGYEPSARAREIFGLDGAGGRLSDFASHCCASLPRLESLRLTRESGGLGVFLGDDDPHHRFSTGESRFVLVRLEDIRKGAMLRIRSFIQEGVFLPSVVFLDRDMAPVRLVTDITFDFTPETWSRYGYLEAFLALSERDDEHWLVVFTDEQDRQSGTIIADESGIPTKTIQHSGTGSLLLNLR